VGGDSDAGIRRAVRLGDGWQTTVSDPERLPERVAALEAALAAAGRPREGFTLSVRVRADLARLERVAPRLRALGVDHVLVDDPDEDPATTRDRVTAMRRLV
jgi:alkanesulfonate monooxygenase SsuD/methylene tetrahydromethanopterin reductase-like flavin-dependent oxidoreductase (luciferase family)